MLDREFDDDEFFDIIHNLQDQFIIRSKKSRTEKEKDTQKKGKKLIEISFEKSYVRKLQRVSFRGKVYQDVKMRVSWNKDGDYNAMKIDVEDRNHKAIYY